MGHTRIYTVGIAFALLLPAGIGVMAIHASPNCQRFVRNYVSAPVRNRVSKATETAWAKWRVGHPNWKPNPNLHRPKYLLTKKEQVDKVGFACEVPTDPVLMGLLFTPEDLVPPPVVEAPPMETTQVEFPEFVPPEIAEVQPPTATPPLGPNAPGIFVPPYTPPIFSGGGSTPVITPPGVVLTPEPSSWLLLGSGIGVAGLFGRRRLKAVA
jgi:hypothetical protein